MTDPFYTEFEKNFRGSHELIMARLSVYDEFLIPLQATHQGACVLDLGCGRGEWIEKMRAMGFAAHGVDLDADMLQAGRDKGLDVHQGDALAYLRAQPDESQLIVSAFHLVEHISFGQLRELLAQAMRVLKPAGLLIMETPNPENLLVATRNFYLDPSHNRPLPPELLTFLSRYAGYARVKLLRLQESPALRDKSAPLLADVIAGASPDYAVIAQKKATASDTAESAGLEQAFSKDIGLSLQTLVERYDNSTQHHLRSMQAQMQVMAEQIEHNMQLMQQVTERAQRTSTQTQSLQAELLAVYQSRSWKITRPLRWLNLQRQRLVEQGLTMRIQALSKKLMRVLGEGWISKTRLPDTGQPVPALTPRAQEIHADLQKSLRESGGA